MSGSSSAFGSTRFHRGDPFEIAAIEPRLKKRGDDAEDGQRPKACPRSRTAQSSLEQRAGNNMHGAPHADQGDGTADCGPKLSQRMPHNFLGTSSRIGGPSLCAEQSSMHVFENYAIIIERRRAQKGPLRENR